MGGFILCADSLAAILAAAMQRVASIVEQLKSSKWSVVGVASRQIENLLRYEASEWF